MSTKSLSYGFDAIVYVFFLTAHDFDFDLAQPSKTFIVPVNLTPGVSYVRFNNFLRDVSIDGQHLCPFHLLGLTSFANIIFCYFHLDLYFTLAYLCMPLEVMSLQGHIYLPSSRKLCSHLFLFLCLKSHSRRLHRW